MKNLILILALILTACGGSGSGGAGSGGGSSAPASACADGTLTGVFTGGAGDILSISRCGFYYGAGGPCQLGGVLANTSNASGSMTLTITEVTGTCGTVPSTTQCGFSYDPNANNGELSLTCADLSINDVFGK